MENARVKNYFILKINANSTICICQKSLDYSHVSFSSSGAIKNLFKVAGCTLTGRSNRKVHLSDWARFKLNWEGDRVQPDSDRQRNNLYKGVEVFDNKKIK